MSSAHPIRAYREREGITAQELARRLDVQPNTIWRWESDRQRIAPSLMARVHEGTGIPVSDLATVGLVNAREAAE